MSCGDPYIKELRSRGYNVVRLPKADIRPLQLLSKRGDTLDRIGELITVLPPTGPVPLPPVKLDTPVAGLSGQRSGELSLGVGLSVLGSVIGAMGGSKLGLDLSYKNAKSVTFEFTDVLEDRVEIAALDQYLAVADVSPFSSFVGKLLEADQLYVTTAVVKSNKAFAIAANTALAHTILPSSGRACSMMLKPPSSLCGNTRPTALGLFVKRDNLIFGPPCRALCQ